MLLLLNKHLHIILITYREELKTKYSSTAKTKIDAEYNRTKQDFKRMELDRLNEYHPITIPNMRATYFAYLQV